MVSMTASETDFGKLATIHTNEQFSLGKVNQAPKNAP